MLLCFPDGVAGVGYLLMRGLAALVAFQQAATAGPAPLWSRVAFAAAAASLLSGCLTRVASGACSLILMAYFVEEPSAMAAERVLAMLAVASVGGGAYSIDCLLFGHRVIRIPHDRG